MKPLNLILISICILSKSYYSKAQIAEASNEIEIQSVPIPKEKKQMNFFIISKRKKGKLDLATRYNIFRTKLKDLCRNKKFASIIAKDGKQMSKKVRAKLEKYNATIGTIWFDSHGMYKKGYSLFFIGNDEYSYKTLKDSNITAPLQKLSRYTNEYTKVIIGSCYGGATYHRPSIDYKDTTRMNGDSLMIGIGKIFDQANIYGSESWVMTKPGLFLRRAAVGGFPGRKLFLDYCYEPAWKNVGRWNRYNSCTNLFEPSNPIAMDIYGNIVVRGQSYIEEKNMEENISKNLKNMNAGLYK